VRSRREMTNLLTRERKILLISGVLLLCVGAIYRFYPELPVFFPQQNEMERKILRIKKYQSMLKSRKALQAQFDAVNRFLIKAESRLLEGETEMLSAVELQNILNDVARQSGVNAESVRIIQNKDKDMGGMLTKISVNAKISASIAEIKKMVYLLENSDKLIDISRFRVRVLNARRPETVQSEFTVNGYMKKTAEQ